MDSCMCMDIYAHINGSIDRSIDLDQQIEDRYGCWMAKAGGVEHVIRAFVDG